MRQELYDDLVAIQQRIHSFEQAVDDQSPEMLFVVEKIMSPNAELVGVCLAKDVPVVQLVGHRGENVYVLKRYTHENRFDAPLSLASDLWQYVRDEMPWDSQRSQQTHDRLLGGYLAGNTDSRHAVSHNNTLKSRDALIDLYQLDRDKKTAVIFSHVLWDATFFYGENTIPRLRKLAHEHYSGRLATTRT